jgi:hypothetical protein
MKYEYGGVESRVTTLEAHTKFGGTGFGIKFMAPSSIYSDYQQLALILLKSFHVLGKNSAPAARQYDYANFSIP